MSQYSGKCDLFDHISGLGGWFNKDGKPIKFGDGRSSVYYSDERLDFLEFKRRTGGVLHQHHKVVVSEYNQLDVKNHCSDFDYELCIRKITDARTKKGYREVAFYIYHYCGKSYNLKELNKKGVYITLDIYFDTLLDLIPYYPYLVTFCSSDKDSEYVVIDDKPWPQRERDGSFKNGGVLFDYWQYYANKLQEHYTDIVLKYFNPQMYEHRELIEFKEQDGKYIGKVEFPIDSNFNVKWDEDKTFWDNPKVIDYDKGLIEMSKENYTQFLGKVVSVYYVAQRDWELTLK